MKNIEKIVLIVAIILVVFALALYFITFGDGTFSDSKAEWGSFGMYFSGLLTPLLLLIIIFMIFIVMKEVRRIFSESSKIEKKFQRQFKKQTTYMEPSADVVYYLQMKDDRLYAIIENIGNQPAFNIAIEFEFDEEVDDRISNNLLPLAEISYLAPEQKSGAVCGIIDESGGSYAISEHTVRMKYKPSEKSRRIIKKEFVIDKNILNTLVPEKSVEESIQNLTENIKDLEHKIQDNEESEEKENVTKTVITEQEPPKKEPEPEDDLSIRRPEKVTVTEEYNEPDEEPEEEPEEESIDIEEPEEEAEIIEEAPEGEEILPPEPEEEKPVEPEPEEKEKKEEEEEKTEEKEEKEDKKPLKRENFDNPFLDDF